MGKVKNEWNMKTNYFRKMVGTQNMEIFQHQIGTHKQIYSGKHGANYNVKAK